MSLTHKGMGFFNQIGACLLYATNNLSGVDSGNLQIQLLIPTTTPPTIGNLSIYLLNNPYSSTNANIEITNYTQNYVEINDNGSYQQLSLTKWLNNIPYGVNPYNEFYITNGETYISNSISASFPSTQIYMYIALAIFNGSLYPSANQVGSSINSLVWQVNWTPSSGSTNPPYPGNTNSFKFSSYIPIP